MKTTLLKTTLIASVMAFSGAAVAASFDDEKADKDVKAVKAAVKADAAKLQELSPEARALKARHKAEWDAMKKSHEAIKANWNNMSEADQKRAETEMKAEAEAMKKRHKAEWAALKA
jgi:hypothetical protein